MEIALSQAKARLTALVRRAEEGEPVILTRNGKPVARIVKQRHWRDMSQSERIASLEAVVASAPKLPFRDPPPVREIQNELDDDIWESHGLS